MAKSSPSGARRKSFSVRVGNVVIGGEAPIVVQSMTNTDTADVEATVAQVAALAQAGSELVRITVDREEAAKAVPYIRDRLDAMGSAYLWSAISITSAISCCSDIPRVPRRWRNIVSTRGMWVSERSVTCNSRQ